MVDRLAQDIADAQWTPVRTDAHWDVVAGEMLVCRARNEALARLIAETHNAELRVRAEQCAAIVESNPMERD